MKTAFFWRSTALCSPALLQLPVGRSKTAPKKIEVLFKTSPTHTNYRQENIALAFFCEVTASECTCKTFEKRNGENLSQVSISRPFHKLVGLFCFVQPSGLTYM